jgi:prepilin-type N-terminal cleavage/methylation domain-containing protein
MNFSRNNGKGFTLIELLVVISIIGILSSIILASLTTARAKGRDATRISDMNQLRNALQLYSNDHNGTYPVVIGANNLASYLVPKYISKIPKDPITDGSYCRDANGYCYYSPAAPGNTYFHIGAHTETITPNSTNDSMFYSGNPGDFNGDTSSASYMLDIKY